MVDDLTCVHSAVGKTQTVSAPIALLICNAISIKQSSDNNLLASATLFFPPLNLLFKERVSRKTARSWGSTAIPQLPVQVKENPGLQRQADPMS